MLKVKGVRNVENSVKVEETAEKTTEDNRELLDIGGKSIESLIEKAEDIKENSSDYLVTRANSENVRFNESAGLTIIPDGGSAMSFQLSRYALGQLGSKIGVPSRYLEKCVSSGRIDLAQDNVNSWLEDFNRDLFVREYRGRVRGILSSRYSVCDTPDILNTVSEVIDTSHYKVKGSYLNEERLHLRLADTEMLPIDGEDLFAGIFIDSSDVGRSILTVKFGIYKQVCTNGLVVARAGGVLFEQKHIGIDQKEFREGLRASLANVESLVENSTQWVKRAKTLGAWGNRRDVRTRDLSKEEMESFINHIRNLTTLSRESSERVVSVMLDKYEDNRWGLINSITEVAQDFTLEKRLDLERVAGDLLVA